MGFARLRKSQENSIIRHLQASSKFIMSYLLGGCGYSQVTHIEVSEAKTGKSHSQVCKKSYYTRER